MSNVNLNDGLFEEYYKKYKEEVFDMIFKDYEAKFGERPPFEIIHNSCDVYSKYTFDEELDIYLTAIRENKPYKLKDGDKIYEDKF